MLNYYDPYRSVPEINKNIYYTNYAQQTSFAGSNQQIVPPQQPKWASQYQINGHSQQVNGHGQAALVNYLERDSSQESYYSNSSTVLPKLKPSLTPSPRKMLTSSFAENGISQNIKGKSRSPQRIYKTHSDINKDKLKKNKSIMKDEGENLRKESDHVLKKEAEILNRKEHARPDNTGDILNQILKKTQSIETNVMVVNHKLIMMENRVETVLANQKSLLAKLDYLEKDMKLSTGLSPELLKEIKDALNIDFDIDLEIKPDEKINKYSINSIKAYKSHGSNE